MASLRSVVGILVLVTAVGCADQGGQTLIILNNAVASGSCEVSPATAGDPVRPLGQVDAAGALGGHPLGYIFTPTIMNIGSSQNGTLTIQRTVILDGARVQVVPGNGPDGMPILSQAELDALGEFNTAFTSPFTLDITPDGGLGAAPFEVLPPPVLAAIGNKLTTPTQLALMRVEVAVFGETIAGTNVESDPFTYPITVCNGCQETRNLGSCVGLEVTGGGCNIFQDGTLDCCTSSMMTQVCPAVPEPMP